MSACSSSGKRLYLFFFVIDETMCLLFAAIVALLVVPLAATLESKGSNMATAWHREIVQKLKVLPM